MTDEDNIDLEQEGRQSMDVQPDEQAAHNSEGTPREMDEVGSDTWLLKKAQETYTTSTDYMDANITNTWEKNLSHFRGEHAPGSNYTEKNYKRSAIFRPKTRANLKAQEASFAVSAFGSQDLIVIEPEDPSDPVQIASARINKSALHYRLKKRMPWFLTVQGAYQNAKVYGVCFSHNYWKYQVDTSIVPAFEAGFDEEGNKISTPVVDEQGQAMGREDRVIRHDDLTCDLIAPENFRFDPMSDWRDPVGTSPYIIYMKPIFVGDALEMMTTNDPKTGKPTWRKYAQSEILATRRQSYDRTRQAREGARRVDPADENYGNEFSMVWAHMNIQRLNGEDYYYWTMGTELVLTDLARIADDYPHLMTGERPFTMGFTSIETHRNYPAGDVELTSGLQEEINLLANQRMDNVKLVLNKRYFVRRGSQTDLDALIRNVPGGGVMMNDPARDVVTINTPDVTSSSYEEQDRLSVEFDTLAGAFSSDSVQSNKNLNETKDGMQRMDGKAGQVEDYSKSIFIQTWMDSTLSQLVRLVQMYETDEVILALAAKEAQLFQRFGVNEVTDQLLRQSLTVNVDIGVGNTDPQRRVEKLIYGIEKVASLPDMVDRIKSAEISDEIFAALGYKTSARFIMNDQEMQEKQQTEGDKPPSPEVQAQMEEFRIREEDNKARDARENRKLDILEKQGTTIAERDKMLKQDEQNLQRTANDNKIQLARDVEASKSATKLYELNTKRAGG